MHRVFFKYTVAYLTKVTPYKKSYLQRVRRYPFQVTPKFKTTMALALQADRRQVDEDYLFEIVDEDGNAI
jgi:hypothetical protein